MDRCLEPFTMPVISFSEMRYVYEVFCLRRPENRIVPNGLECLESQLPEGTIKASQNHKTTWKLQFWEEIFTIWGWSWTCYRYWAELQAFPLAESAMTNLSTSSIRFSKKAACTIDILAVDSTCSSRLASLFNHIQPNPYLSRSNVIYLPVDSWSL